jgi:hypothetical protein
MPKIINFLQPFGRIAYVTDRTKVKAKSDVRASKCVFVGYANDHSGDTYKFYNPATKQTILSRDVHQWMERHGRITALDDLALFDEIDRIKTDSIILPASPDVPLLPEDDVFDADNLWDLPALVPTNTEDSVVQPGALRPARRNLARAYGSGAVTRARARAATVTFADGPRNDDTTLAMDTCTSTTEGEVIFNAQLRPPTRCP